jgi:DNA gyrase subunit A
MGRATQGVKLINEGKDSIAAVTKVMKDDAEVVVDEDGNVVEVAIEELNQLRSRR